MDVWHKIKAADLVDFNPQEHLPKDVEAKKVAMEHLRLLLAMLQAM